MLIPQIIEIYCTQIRTVTVTHLSYLNVRSFINKHNSVFRLIVLAYTRLDFEFSIKIPL